MSKLSQPITYLSRYIASVSLLGAAMMIGCGKSEVPLAHVEGTILLDGQPLANAIVEFQPEGPVGKVRPSIGETGPDGKYKLRFSRDRWGAVVGNHKVLITTFSPSGDGKFKERVPATYNSATTLRRTVERQSNWLDFDLQTQGSQGPTLAAGE